MGTTRHLVSVWNPSSEEDAMEHTLSVLLEEVAALRNPVAHTSRVRREQAMALRDRLVGVGQGGTFVELGTGRLVS